MKKQNTKPLRLALLGNAVFSAISAAVLIIFPDRVGSLIGTSNHVLLMVIGIGLGVFSLDLFHQASRQRMQTWRALYSSLGDATWVLGTVILLIWFPNLVSEKGSVLLICIALIVALFGALQLWGAGEAHRLKGTELYRHCVAVTVPETVDKMWEAVSDLSGISKYFPALRSSTIRGGVEPQVGAIRQCEDHSGKTWAEKCTKFEIGKRIELEFLCDEDGFPYPASEMIGGWSLLENGNGSTEVHIWWELKPKPTFMAPLILPLLGLKADIDFPTLVFRMAGCESHPKIAKSTLGRLILPAHSC